MAPPPRRVDSMPVSIVTDDIPSERSSVCSEVESVALSSSRGKTSSARSKYRDTLMNSINYMIGSAMLSMPYAFAKGGWMTVVFSFLISAFGAFTAFLLGRIQSDVLRVTPPLGVHASAAGHYARCQEARKDGKRRYRLVHTSPQPIFDQHLVGNAEEALQKRFRSDAKKGKAHVAEDPENQAVQGMPLSVADLPAEEVQKCHHYGAWVATWVQDERRWRLQYEGPRLVDKERDDGEHYTAAINDPATSPRGRRASQGTGEQQGLLAAPQQYVRITFDQAPMLDRLQRYPDIADGAFGRPGFVVIQMMFTAELYLFMVSWVIVAVQNLEVVITSLSTNALTAIYGGAILVPTLVRDFSSMSFLSFFGLFACGMILVALAYVGFTTKHGKPGSLIDPGDKVETSVMVWSSLPLSLSLVMSAFGGHSLMPSIRADMRKPISFKRVVRWTFVVSGVFYATVGALGYGMYGKDVSDIVNLNFDQSAWITKVVAVLLVVVQYTKHGLANNALCGFFEDALSSHYCKPGWVVYGPVRITVLVAIVFGSILIPNFSTVMSLIGASISCTVSLIFPLAAYMRLKWYEMTTAAIVFQSILLVLASALAITGTIQALGVTF